MDWRYASLGTIKAESPKPGILKVLLGETAVPDFPVFRRQVAA